MVNGANQILTALMGSNVKKSGSNKEESQVFQELMALLMAQGMTIEEGGPIEELISGNINELVAVKGLDRFTDQVNTAMQTASLDNPFRFPKSRGISGFESQAENLGKELLALQTSASTFEGNPGSTQRGLLETEVVRDSSQLFVSYQPDQNVQEGTSSLFPDKPLHQNVQSVEMLAQVGDNLGKLDLQNPSIMQNSHELSLDGVLPDRVLFTQSPLKDLQYYKLSSGNANIQNVRQSMNEDNGTGLTVEQRISLGHGQNIMTKNLSGGNKEFTIQSNRKTGAEGIEEPKAVQSEALTGDEALSEENILVRPEVMRMVRGTEGLKENITFSQDAAKEDAPAVDDKKDISREADRKEDVFMKKNGDKEQSAPAERHKDSFAQVNESTRNFETRDRGAEQVLRGPAEVNREDVLNQIYDRIKVQNVKDMSELTVRLKPESLGEVAIKLVMDKGVLTGRILVENNHVKSLIESSLPQIKENLRGQNPEASGLNITVGLGSESQTYNQNYSSNRWGHTKRQPGLRGNIESIKDTGLSRVQEYNRGLNILA